MNFCRLLCVAFTALTISASIARSPDPDAGYFVHTAVEGDSLAKLAARYQIKRHDWATLQKLNHIPDPTRIKPGTRIRIPVPGIRREPADLKVLAAQGQVDSDGRPLTAGTSIKEGQRVNTGDNGFVTLQLADGSTLTVQSKSQVKVESARALANTGGILDSVFRVVSGRVEAGVERQRGPAARFEVKTDTSTMGVRGTRFRVAADPGGKATKSEVLTGKVGVAAEGVSAAEMALDAGFGTVVEAGKAPLPPVKLLPEPVLAGIPARAERTLVSFKFAAVADASGYRAQVARDAAFRDVQADTTSLTPEVAFSTLPDGVYFLRIRAIDKLGLEGKDATHAFTLAARPEPPVILQPANGASVVERAVRFAWTAHADATAYRLQVAKDPGFQSPLINEAKVSANSFQARPLAPGEYHWRLASVQVDGKSGPWGDASRFILRPAPAEPDEPRQEGGKLIFSWRGEPGVTYEVQLALDERFRRIVSQMKTDQPEATLDRPPVGVYHMRYRVLEADGTVGPFSTTRSVDIYPLGR